MRLAPAAEFAIRGVLVLAEHYGEGPVNLDKICRIRDLSKQYMTKIFASLNRAGITQAIRGKHGGYVLNREPKDVTLLEIIEAVEGPIQMNFCMQEPPHCKQKPGCPVHPVWEDIQNYIRTRLGSVTMADCVGCC